MNSNITIEQANELVSDSMYEMMRTMAISRNRRRVRVWPRRWNRPAASFDVGDDPHHGVKRTTAPTSSTLTHTYPNRPVGVFLCQSIYNPPCYHLAGLRPQIRPRQTGHDEIPEIVKFNLPVIVADRHLGPDIKQMTMGRCEIAP